MDAEYVHGKPTMVDYTPGVDVAAGAVVVVGDTPRIAHLDIPANELGSLAAEGGVYKVPTATGGGSAIGDGKKVYWDAGNSVVTETASTHKMIGYTIVANLDADDSTLIKHHPAIYGPDAVT